jgi:hypothetical protein
MIIIISWSLLFSNLYLWNFIISQPKIVITFEFYILVIPSHKPMLDICRWNSVSQVVVVSLSNYVSFLFLFISNIYTIFIMIFGSINWTGGHPHSFQPFEIFNWFLVNFLYYLIYTIQLFKQLNYIL